MKKLIDKKTEELEARLLSNREFNMLNYQKQNPLLILKEHLKDSNITNREIATKMEISESLVSKILSGERINRDNIIKLCIVAEVELEIVNQVLKYLSIHPLYVKDRRDAVIIHGIHNKQTIAEINQTLADHKIKLL